MSEWSTVFCCMHRIESSKNDNNKEEETKNHIHTRLETGEEERHLYKSCERCEVNIACISNEHVHVYAQAKTSLLWNSIQTDGKK